MKSDAMFQYGLQTCMNYYNIECDTSLVSPNEDLLIGTNEKITLTIENGTELKVKNMVVHGHLTIKSKHESLPSEQNATLKAEDLYVTGTLIVHHANIVAVNCDQMNRSEFQLHCLETIMDMLRRQRDIVNKIGLKSILFVHDEFKYYNINNLNH